MGPNEGRSTRIKPVRRRRGSAATTSSAATSTPTSEVRTTPSQPQSYFPALRTEIQQMKFVEEIVVEEFLPTVRSMLAAELRDRGLTQREVASVLGISQSAVSKYAHGEVTINDEIADDERVREHVDELAAGLADGSVTSVQALVDLE